MRLFALRPYYKIIAGAEIYLLNIFRGFRKFFPEVKFIFITTSDILSSFYQSAGAQVKVVNVFSEEIGTKRQILRFFPHVIPFIFNYLRVILREDRSFHFGNIPSVAHKTIKNKDIIIMPTMTEKIFLTPFLRLFGLKVVWLELGPIFSTKRAKEIIFLYKLVSSLVSHIIVCSKDTLHDLEKGGINPEKIAPIYVGVDAGFFQPLGRSEKEKIKRDLGLEDKTIVGFWGTICFEKGIGDFMETSKIVASKSSVVRFMIIGDGPELKWAKKYARENKLTDKIIFVPFQKDIRRFGGIIDVFFFPTRHIEGLPAAILEAMAMGIPVVAKNLGGVGEVVINNRTGNLYKDSLPQETAEMIINLAQDREKRNIFGKNARRLIEKYYNLDSRIRRLHSLFLKIEHPST